MSNNKFNNFDALELEILAGAMIGEKGKFLNMFDDGVPHAEEYLIVINNLISGMIDHIEERQLMLVQDIEELRTNNSYYDN